MKFLNRAALTVAMVAAGFAAQAADLNKYRESGNFRADTAQIDSGTSIVSGSAILGQDRRMSIYASSTASVAADVWGTNDIGTRLTKLGSFTATSASTGPVSLTVTVIPGLQRVIISPTSGLTGVEKLHVTLTQSK